MKLDSELTATCPACTETITVTLTAVHTGTDYASDPPVHKATVQASYTHTCQASDQAAPPPGDDR